MLLSQFSVAELHAEISSRKGAIINFGKSSLKIDSSQGGGVYQTDASWMDFHDPLYVDIKRVLNPSLIIDVGANIGFLSVCFGEKFPEARIVAIEPNPDLVSIFHENMQINAIENYKLITKAAGSANNNLNFLCRPGFSVDATVCAEDDVSFVSEQVTLDKILEDSPDAQAVYIKIDVQGYDYEVIKGGLDFFSRSKNFIVRVEFAPAWLERQGVDLHEFLSYLINNFDVAELKKFAFRGGNLADTFEEKLKISDVHEFINYARQRSSNGSGYTDIIFKPKSLEVS